LTGLCRRKKETKEKGKKAKEKIQRQRDELYLIKTNLLNVSLELEKKKRLLDTSKEKNEYYNKMQEEIILLTANYKELQNKSLENSPPFNDSK